MNQSVNFWQRFDYIMFVAALALIVFGIMIIASATQGAVDPELISRLPDQITFAVVGVIAMFIFAAIDYKTLCGISPWLYIIMVVLLLMVPAFGVVGDAGARRWLNLGIRIQPSEIGKIIIIITLSTFMARRYQEMDKLTTIFKSLLHVAPPIALIFIQPDLGTTIVFIVIWATIIWAAGLRLRHIAIMGTATLIMMPIGISQLQPYQLSRITTFIFEDSDPDAQYNINQARIAIGSGGLVGKGYMVGSQNAGRFLRVRHTDFIFSVIAHEFGMIGGLLTMGALGIILIRILRGAQLAADPAGSMICYGVAGMIFFQTTVSIGMNLNLMPVTGLTLPFVSSGGTSLLFTMIGIGLVQSVIVRRARVKR